MPVDPIEAAEAAFRTPPADARIMMRWWWFGPDVTEAGITAQMHRMAEAGIGGVEIAFVYPMIAHDGEAPDFPSPELLGHIGFAARLATALGLRFHLTIGSGWSYGGRHITRDLAARCLRFEEREVAPSLTEVIKPVPFDGDDLLGAYIGPGSRQETPDDFTALDITGDGPIKLPAGQGPRLLVFVHASHTGQVVKRACLGADGYVLDHYSEAAIEAHLRAVGDPMLDAVPPGSVASIFCDSLEVYGANWTTDLPDQFRRRRGYDLIPLLPLIAYPTARATALRRDFGRTLTELYEERFLRPMRHWAERRGVLFRVQNYGEPPGSIASARQAHLIEGEGWGWRVLTQSRWATSAGHLFGKPVISSETWTWAHSPSLRATPLDLLGEAHEHFLVGINQLIGHGWPYSPEDAPAPGWLFYAAAALDQRNPWWPVMPDIAAYLQRLSALLRLGTPVAGVGLYAPNEDAWGSLDPAAPKYPDLWYHVRKWIGPDIVPAILDAGHDYDLFDDETLPEAQARGFRVIVLPKVHSLPQATRTWLQDFMRNGGQVLAVGTSPVEGVELVAEAALTDRLMQLALPDVAITPAASGIGFVHRRLDGADVYFLANTGGEPRDATLHFDNRHAHAELWDPLTGTATVLPVQDGSVALHFAATTARVVVLRAEAGAATDAVPPVAGRILELRNGWTVSIAGGPAHPVALPHSWTEDAATRHHSGTASYRCTFTLPQEGGTAILDLGAAEKVGPEMFADGTIRGAAFAALAAPPVREAATVFVNGRRAGALWGPTYRLDLTPHLQDGTNDLQIDVHNTGMNAMSAPGGMPDMQDATLRHGRRARMQDFEKVHPLPSGLLKIPRMILNG
jgi:hypothetical protein